MRIINLATICALFLTLEGCASIAGNNTRSVSVVSDPPGAAIYVDNQQYGVTPAVINLPDYIYGGKSITVKKKGFQPKTMVVNAKFQPVSLFNILFWPGFLIDAVTGDLVKIDPANLHLNYDLNHA